RLERLGEARDPPVVVGAALGDKLGLPEELDRHAAGRRALAGVEHVRRERGGHARTLRLEAAAEPGERLRSLGALELAQGRQPWRWRQRRSLDEEAGQGCKHGVDVLRGRAPRERVVVEEL